MMAPVGTELVLVTGLCSEQGQFMTRQPVEWTLTPDSVGYFVQADDDPCLSEILHCNANKRDGSYAVTRSATDVRVLTRGTPEVDDDVRILKGQSWVSVTSPTEGTTHVGVIAPKAKNWKLRRQTATIYWVDVQWTLPAPAVIAASEPHRLTTMITRMSGKPQPGWIVRYEIVNADVSSFGSENPTVLDAISDQNGQASVNLVPANKSGSTQIRIKIIRPAKPDDDLPQMVVGQGFTSVTWSAPDPQVTLYGPESAGIGSTVSYRAQISNAGDVAARQVVASTSVPPNMTLLRTDPPAKVIGNTLTWTLGDLAAQSTQNFQIDCRPDRNGSVRFCLRVESADQIQGRPLTAEACVETRVFTSALSLKVAGPDSVEVGQTASFQIQVTNTGYDPLNDVVIRDRLPAGLEHPSQTGSLLERRLREPLAPGETRDVPVQLTATRAGRLCHTVEVVAQGGHAATATACVTATEPPPPPQPQPQPGVAVAVDGPVRARVGDQVTFTIRVSNTGNIPLNSLQIVATHAASLYPRQASGGFDVDRLARGEIVWTQWQLQPGETLTREVNYECRQESANAWCRVLVESAEGAQGVKEASIAIEPQARPAPGTVEPPPRIEPPGDVEPEPSQVTGELKVSIADRQDPIQINGTTTYIVVIENARNVPDKNVKLTLLFPAGMEFVKVNGPVGAQAISPDGRTVEVTPIQVVRAGETLSAFYVEARGIQIGKHVVTARVSSFRSPQPVESQTETTVNISG
jgi:uncharacterized repeat protein (TIGR01451 family)